MSTPNDPKAPIVNGRTAQPKSIYDQDYDDNADIDRALKKELLDQSLAYKWIDYKKAVQNGGRNHSGWIVYQRKSQSPIIAGLEGFSDPNGLVRNGTLVLAVKTYSNRDKYRAKVAKARMSLSQFTHQKAEEMRQMARRLGDTRIIEGYEANLGKGEKE